MKFPTSFPAIERTLIERSDACEQIKSISSLDERIRQLTEAYLYLNGVRLRTSSLERKPVELAVHSLPYSQYLDCRDQFVSFSVFSDLVGALKRKLDACTSQKEVLSLAPLLENLTVARSISEEEWHFRFFVKGLCIHNPFFSQVEKDRLDASLESIFQSSDSLPEVASRVVGLLRDQGCIQRIAKVIDVNLFVPIIGGNPLFLIFFLPHAEAVSCLRLLVALGANINEPCCAPGYTPLTYAVLTNNIALVEKLCELGADINHVDRNGKLPLTCAVDNDAVPMVQKLCELGADRNKQDLLGCTPFIRAVDKGSVAMVQKLYDLHVNMNVSGSQGFTALTRVVAKGDAVMTAMLLNLIGMDVDLPDGAGRTPLLCAMMGHNTVIANILLDRGANREISEKLVLKKKIAHIWTFSGFDEERESNGTTYRIPFEGESLMDSQAWVASYIREFVERIPQPYQKWIKEYMIENSEYACSSAIHHDGAITSKSIVQRIQARKTTELSSGFRNHAYTVYFDRDKLYVCNRGQGMTQHAIECYSCPAAFVTEDMVEKLRGGSCLHEEMRTFFHGFPIGPKIEEECFDMKPQKVGNCAWANTKPAAMILEYLALHDMIPDPRQRWQICHMHYKMFFSPMCRVAVAEEYLSQSYTLSPKILVLLVGKLRSNKRIAPRKKAELLTAIGRRCVRVQNV